MAVSQYHAGEIEAQRLAGEREIAEAREGMMQPRIIAAAVRWLAAQTLLVVGTVDAQGRPWASIVAGEAGFLRPSEDGRTLHIEACLPETVKANLARDERVGLLVMDLLSRTRMRVNGTVVVEDCRAEVRVQESFFNCPKYITRRFVHAERAAAAPSSGEHAGLPQEYAGLLRGTDVMFVATLHPERGLDVSHRGGDPGFVHVGADGVLRVPDYNGNSLFNTLGNLLVDPHIGVAVPNLTDGTALEMTGRAGIVWDDPDEEGMTGGTHRVVEIGVDAWRVVEDGLVAGAQRELSPFNPR